MRDRLDPASRQVLDGPRLVLPGLGGPQGVGMPRWGEVPRWVAAAGARA